MMVPQGRSGSLRGGWQLVLSLAALLLAVLFALDLRHLNEQRSPVIDAVAAGARAGAQAVCEGVGQDGVLAAAREYAGSVYEAPVAAELDGSEVTVSATVSVSSFFAPVVRPVLTRVQASVLAECAQPAGGAQVIVAASAN